MTIDESEGRAPTPAAVTAPHELPRRRPLAALIWTVALAMSLWVVDRLVVGPPVVPTWVEVTGLANLPDTAGATVVPAYLPDTLSWPPARVLRRGDRAPGWWIGLSAPEGGEPHLWIGSQLRDASAAIGPPAGCLAEMDNFCPAGWSALSTEVAPEAGVVVVGDLPPLQLRRIVEGLRRE